MYFKVQYTHVEKITYHVHYVDKQLASLRGQRERVVAEAGVLGVNAHGGVRAGALAVVHAALGPSLARPHRCCSSL